MLCNCGLDERNSHTLGMRRFRSFGWIRRAWAESGLAIERERQKRTSTEDWVIL
jgi:hypothetical protein